MISGYAIVNICIILVSHVGILLRLYSIFMVILCGMLIQDGLADGQKEEGGEAGMIEIFDSIWAIFMVLSEKIIDIIFLFFFSSAEGLFICR